MAPEDFVTFFLATAGAGSALIGLLFVAISVHPRRTFDHQAAAGEQRQRLAEAALLTLFHGFIVSCGALIPGFHVGGIALPMGGIGVFIAVQLVGSLSRTHRHDPARPVPWLHLLRVLSLSLVAAVLYAVEGVHGWSGWVNPLDDLLTQGDPVTLLRTPSPEPDLRD